MTPLIVIFLLTFVQAEFGSVSSSSPVFGPSQVTGLLGGSVTVKCFYPQTSVNRHSRKYWCRESTRQCSTIVSSNGFVAKDFTGRATLTDFPENGIFIIEISELQGRDMGPYKCGIGFNDKGLSFRVNLDVSQDSVMAEEAQLFYIEQHGSLTITCDFGEQYASTRKYLCKMRKNSCANVIDTYGNFDPHFKGRALISHLDVPGAFNVIMTQLKKEDSGLYLCGVGNYGADGETKKLDVRVYEEALVPKQQAVLRGVLNGSVSTECHYDPKGNDTIKYWCKWKKHGCTQLINNNGYVLDSYEGRLVIYDNPENGTFTIILNQLKEEDIGYYWCMTDGEQEKKSTAELKIVEGQPSLTGENEISVVVGSPLTMSCSYSCEYAQYEKYWCKWKNTGCEPLKTHEQDQTGLAVSCDKGRRVLSLNFDQVTLADQGWYWCGVKRAGHYGETFAVHLTVHGVLKNTGTFSESEPDNLTISLEAPNSDVESRYAANPKINLENKASPINEPGVGSSADSQSGSKNSTIVLSTVIPLAVAFLILAAVLVVKFKLFKHSDLVSVGSYRTNISMTDFENARQYGAKDNVCMDVAHETQIGGLNDYVIATGSPKEEGKAKKPKRGSKEEVEMAYTTFLLNSENIPPPEITQE
ncbi:polymeric immunoglobulin receptor [Tiliqua scincoides]|uniref:polymeric immunoglobulin receptor n=1 Tax=Tiliqua scincoides TaxID=71010 RepID=UPI003462415C